MIPKLTEGMPIVARVTQPGAKCGTDWLIANKTYVIRTDTTGQPFIIDSAGDNNYCFDGDDVMDLFHFPGDAFPPETNSQFIKADDGKPMVSLVEPAFIMGVGKILSFGAIKYDRDNWKQLPPSELYRYKDAAYRHFLAYLDGELIDPESGQPHLDHLACNVMFLRYFEHQKDNNDTSI